MKKYAYLLLLILSSRCTPGEEQEQAVPEEKREGLFSFNIHTVYCEIDANTGGRITSFKIDSTEMLSGKEANSENWGSTFWTSPQSEWGWPPSANIDRNAYKSKIENNSLILESGKDEKLGYSVTKKITGDLKDTSIVLHYTITNNSNEKRKVAPWEVTRLPADGLTLFPSATGEKKGDLVPMVYDENGVSYFEHDAGKIPQKGVPQLYEDGSEGWMAYINDGVAFIKKFGDVSAKKTAPNESEIELYVNPDNKYMEIEEQGEYAELKPGESLHWEVKWYLRKIPSAIKVEKGNEKLVNYIRNTINK